MNLRKLTIHTKLIGSFIIVACSTFLTGYVGWRIATTLSDHLQDVGAERMPSMYHLMQINEQLDAMRIAEMALLDPDATPADRMRQYRIMEEARAAYGEALSDYSDRIRTADELQQLERLAELFRIWQAEHEKLLTIARRIDSLDLANPIELKKNLERFRGDLYKLRSEASYFIQTNTPFEGGEDPQESAFGQWMAGFTTNNDEIRRMIDDIARYHTQFYAASARIKRHVPIGQIQDASLVFFTEMIPAAEQLFDYFDALLGKAQEAEDLFAELNDQAKVHSIAAQYTIKDLLQQIIDANDAAAAQAVADAARSARWAKTNALVGCILGTVMSLLFGYVLSFSITGRLNRIIEMFQRESSELDGLATKIASGSGLLAEASGAQAAQIEESAAAIQELAAATRQNAAGAARVSDMMREAMVIVNTVERHLEDVTGAVGAIMVSSEQSSKIVGTINDIALKTNLLALNAAIEAAHAGEAGRGFAVVADEVRTLAQHAAAATKNTAGLIQEIISAVQRSGALTSAAGTAFGESRDVTRQVEELVREIASSSTEQSRSIEQIHGAIAETDLLMQRNADNAQDAAAVALALSDQSQRIIQTARELMAFVRGGENGTHTLAVQGTSASTKTDDPTGMN